MLLATQGRSPDLLFELCERGWLLVAREVGSDELEPPLGAAIVVALDYDHTYELAAFAVGSAGPRHASNVLADVIDVLRADGARRVVAAVSDLAGAGLLTSIVSLEL